MKRESSGGAFGIATQLLYAGVLMALVLLTQNSSGQGQINFNNYVPSANPPIDAPIWTFPTNVGGTLLSGTDSTFRAALTAGPTNGIPSTYNSIGNLSLLASPYTGGTFTTFRTGANAGFFAVGTDGVRDSGFPYGSTVMFQVVMWHGTETTWAQAYADFKAGLILAGASDPLILKTSLSASDPNVPNLTGLTSFGYFVPEPSSLSLMLVGLGSWWLYRRIGRNGTT
jgi:hypothetical protein